MPRYQLSIPGAPPPQELPEPPSLAAEAGKWFMERSGEDLDRAMAMQELRAIAPDLAELYDIEAETEGTQRSARDLYTTLRQFRSPGWSAAGGGDKALGLALFAGQYPVAGALGAVAPGVGHVAGWGAMRHMAHLANPEMAGASLAWDVAGAVGAKGLGTAASMAYRSKVMPELAKRGLTSKELHPVASRVLDWAEGAMDPLIGPKARNIGMPRWMNRRLQKLGPQGPPSTGRPLPLGQMIQGEIPGTPGQTTLPGMKPKEAGRLPAPTKGARERPDQLAYKYADTELTPAWKKAIKETRGQRVATEAQQEMFGPDPARQVGAFRTALEDLPPVPEDLTTLSQVGQAAQIDLGVPQVARQGRLALGGPSEGFPFPAPETPAPPAVPAAAGAAQEPIRFPGPAVQQSMPGIGPEGAKLRIPGPVQERRILGAPEPRTAAQQAVSTRVADQLVATVGRGEKLTWKQYAAGLQKATGLGRREMTGVLRVHKALASSYGETPDEMIGRMFRGVMTQEEHATTFPGLSKWTGGQRGPAGVAHWMDDGRAILAFSDRVRTGQVKSATQLEAALHEPLHVFYKWMPAREKAVLTKALKGKVNEAWTEEQEHQAITWALEYLRSGKAPTKTLARTFENFRQWLRRLITKGKKGRGPKEVEEVLERMLSPEGFKKRALAHSVKKRVQRGA